MLVRRSCGISFSLRWRSFHIFRCACIRITALPLLSANVPFSWDFLRHDGRFLAGGRKRPSYEYNVEVTRRTVEMAHACGVSVEGELGQVFKTGQAGEEDGVGAEGTLSHDQLLTDPEEAADFWQPKLGSTPWQFAWDQPTVISPASPEIFWPLAEPGDSPANSNTHLLMHGSSSATGNGWQSQ